MDPQRQHAQLLAVWAQGNKAFRRWQHYRPLDYAPWGEFEPWWNLARKLEEKGLVARLFPAPNPVILVSGLGANAETWCAVVSDAVPWREIFKQIVTIHRGPEALAWNAREFTVSMACAARLGRAQWGVLAHQEHFSGITGSMTWEAVEEALNILTMLAKNRRRPAWWTLEDLEALARLWRHQGHPQKVVLEEPTRYPWVKIVQTRDGQRYEWPSVHGQDEDIVH